MFGKTQDNQCRHEKDEVKVESRGCNTCSAWMEMEALPDELHVHIFSFLSVFDLCRYVSPAPFMI